jgi:hypothetical protein
LLTRREVQSRPLKSRHDIGTTTCCCNVRNKEVSADGREVVAMSESECYAEWPTFITTLTSHVTPSNSLKTPPTLDVGSCLLRTWVTDGGSEAIEEGLGRPLSGLSRYFLRQRWRLAASFG